MARGAHTDLQPGKFVCNLLLLWRGADKREATINRHRQRIISSLKHKQGGSDMYFAASIAQMLKPDCQLKVPCRIIVQRVIIHPITHGLCLLEQK